MPTLGRGGGATPVGYNFCTSENCTPARFRTVSSVTLSISNPDARCDVELDRGLNYSVTARTPARVESLLEQLLQQPGAQVADSVGGLISSITVLENIALPGIYHGYLQLAHVDQRVMDAFAGCGLSGRETEALCRKRPGQIDPFEKRLAGFVRSLLAGPQLIVYSRFFEGLTRAEMARASALNAVYRERNPSGTAVYLMLGDMPGLQPDCQHQVEM